MNQAPLSLESIKQIKCPIHSYQSLDLVDLTGISQNGRICMVCVQQNNILSSEYLSMNQLFHQEEEVIISYPPFKNKEIRDLINKYCNENLQKSNIDSFFLKLREDIEVAIQQAENRAKQEFIQNQYSQQKLRNEINKIAEKDKLKQLLVSGSQELNKFLQEKWNSAEQNEKQIQTCIREVLGSCSIINLSQRQKEINILIQSLSQLTLFDQSVNYIGSTINCVPSKNYQDSKQYLEIQRQGGEMIVTNKASAVGCRSFYLEQALDSSKRYVIQLELNSNHERPPYFYIGLIEENKKDDFCVSSFKIYYNEYGYNGTISQMTKGYSVQSQSNQKQIGKKRLEFRIYLNEYVVKVSSPPNYQCVAQLNDNKWIDLSKNYYFSISIYNPHDYVTIQNVLEVPSFNSNM